MEAQPLYDLAPALRLALLGIAVAAGPLAWVWLRNRNAAPGQRLAALTLLTLFLTFDLVLFGAFTRLTDSGLGCPDWPGCYGNASPTGALEQIRAEEARLPTGPVTHGKAWIEMIHRYLATGVGVLITTLAVATWLQRKRGLPVSPVWPALTFVWVCVQGAFGALTVTMKLYPAIVTLHLLGGMALLALLAIQAESYAPRRLTVSPGLRTSLVAVAVLTLAQITLGGWVSTNYAVLACQDFPTCQGSWWPPMAFDEAFAVRRPLGGGADGGYLPFPALTAIHMAHRLGAAVLLPALALLAWRLHAESGAGRPWARILVGIGLWQFASGLSNVLLGWPLVAAVAHTAGSAALVVTLTFLLVRTGRGLALGEAWTGPVRPLAS